MRVPRRELLSFLGHFYVVFPYLEHFPSFGWFVQKVVVIRFSDSIVQKGTQQLYGSRNVTSDYQLLCKVFKKQPFHFCKNIKKYCERKVLHCSPRYRDVLFTQFQIWHFLLGNDEVLLKKLEPKYFTNQHVDCFCTHLKYRFSVNIVAKSGHVQLTVCFIQWNRGVNRMLSVAERDSWGKSTGSFHWAHSNKHHQGKPVDQYFQKLLLNKLGEKDKILAGSNKKCWLFPRWWWFL